MSKHLASLGEEPQSLVEELHPGHLRHALVDDKQGYRLIPLLELCEHIQADLARLRLEDAVIAAIFLAQVTLDCIQHIAVIVHCQNNCFRHLYQTPSILE